jgi:hypothetical protein
MIISSGKHKRLKVPHKTTFKRDTSGKKKLANDFSLWRTCHWHLLGAIGSRLAVNWQMGQLIDFSFSCIALYSAIGSHLAVNWQVGQLISN